MRYRPELDGLRALAVLAVIGAHSTLHWASGGTLGVTVFFTLSGYLITALLLAEHEGTGRVRIGAFYARRALRLYPALLLLVLLGLPFYRHLGSGSTPGIDSGTLAGYGRTALAALLYVEDLITGLTGHNLGGFAHTWSLSVEEQFYLLWPPVLLLLIRRRNPLLPTIAAAVASLILFTTLLRSPDGGQPSGAYFLPWTRFYDLLIGCALAIYLVQRTAPRVARSQSFGWTAAGLGLVAVLVAGQVDEYPHLMWEDPLIAVLTAAMILHLTTGPTMLRAALGARPLAYIGRRSYGLYLFHYPIFYALLPHLHFNRYAGIAVCVVLTFALAIVSYRFVEMPFLRRKARLRPPSEAALPAGT